MKRLPLWILLIFLMSVSVHAASATLFYDNAESGTPTDAAHNWSNGNGVLYNSTQSYDGTKGLYNPPGGFTGAVTTKNMTNMTYPFSITYAGYTSGSTRRDDFGNSSVNWIAGWACNWGGSAQWQWTDNSGSSFTNTGIACTGGWHLFNVTFTNSTFVTAYADGSLIKNGTTSSAFIPNGTGLRLDMVKSDGSDQYADIINVSTTNIISVPSLTLQLNNVVNNSAISGFCINATGTNTTFNQCNATGTSLTMNNTGTYNITWYNITGGASTPTYYNVTMQNVIFNTAMTITNTTYQSLFTIMSYQLFTNNSITNFNTTNNKATNNTVVNNQTTIPANNGTNNIQIDVGGNYTINVTCTSNQPLTTTPCNATGIYDNLFTIGANSSGSVSNFSIVITNKSIGNDLYNISTTNGSITFPLLQGYHYLFSIQSNGYAYTNTTLQANATTNRYNFSLYQTNTLNITFFDETNTSTVIGPNISLQLSSTPQSAIYSTINGTIITSILIPATYKLTYSSTSYTTRSYQFILVNNTYTNLRLPMLLSSAATTITVTVVDNTGTLLKNATVKLYLYDITTNTYSVNQVFTSNDQGIGVMNVQLNTATYYFTVDYQGSTRLITTPSAIYANTIQLTVPLNNPGFSKLFDNNNLVGIISNTSNTLYNFLWNDADNIAASGCLYAYQFTSTTLLLYNSTCANASGGTVTTGIDNGNNQTYYLYGIVTKNGQTYLLDSKIIKYDTAPPTEAGTKIWLLIMLLIITILVIIFRSQPSISVMTAGIIPLLFSSTGLISLGIGYTIPIFIIAIIIGISIGK